MSGIQKNNCRQTSLGTCSNLRRSNIVSAWRLVSIITINVGNTLIIKTNFPSNKNFPMLSRQCWCWESSSLAVTAGAVSGNGFCLNELYILLMFSIQSKCRAFLNPKLALLTVLLLGFLYEGYENFTLRDSLKKEKLKTQKIKLEARKCNEERRESLSPEKTNKSQVRSLGSNWFHPFPCRSSRPSAMWPRESCYWEGESGVTLQLWLVTVLAGVECTTTSTPTCRRGRPPGQSPPSYTSSGSAARYLSSTSTTSERFR